MRVPAAAVVAAAVIAAVPCGWMLGVSAAELILGRDIGVFPVLTIPLGLGAAIAFALAPILRPSLRLAAMIVLTVALGLLA